MLSVILVAASGIAIPFGDGPAAPAETTTGAPAARVETSFEFAERPGGYQLNALVFDLSRDSRQAVPVASCQRIDIDSFTESDFGTPVLCDGVSYSFDLRGDALVVDGLGAARPVPVHSFPRGRILLNGMPLIIE